MSGASDSGRDRDRQVREELRAHFEELVGEQIRAGRSRAAAEAEARRRFGDLDEHVRAGIRARRRLRRGGRRLALLAGLLQDVGFAIRSLRARPTFSLGAVLLLGAGIGVPAGLFSLARGVLLEPLPFHRAEQLYLLHGAPVSLAGTPGSPDDLFDWRRHLQGAFAEYAAFHPFPHSVNLTWRGEATEVGATEVTDGFFEVLGQRMLLGRHFDARDRDAGARVAVIGERLWRRFWDADPAILGREVTVRGQGYRVVGVVPSRAQVPAEVDVWIPMDFDGTPIVRGARIFRVLGRMADGVEPETAAARVAAFRERLLAERGDLSGTTRDRDLVMRSLHDSVVAGARSPIWLLFAATALVLAVADANLASLMLARSHARRSEYAVRAALGAGIRRLVQQSVIESLLLSLAGAAVGCLVASWLLGLARNSPQLGLPRAESLSMDGSVPGFAVVAAVLSALAFGLLPALSAARAEMSGALASTSRSGGDGAAAGRPRDLFLVFQVAVSLVLALGAGLLVRSYTALRAVDTGFDSEVLTLAVNLQEDRYPDATDALAFTREANAALRAVPGVRAAGATNLLPLADSTGVGWGFEIEGADSGPLFPTMVVVTDGFFDAMGMRIRSGRSLEPGDGAGQPRVAVVNRAFVREHLAGGAAPGTRLVAMGESEPIEVVGVVDDVRRWEVETEAIPEIYVPIEQSGIRARYFVLAVEGDVGAVADAARDALQSVAPSLPLYDVRSMADRVHGALAQPRLLAILLGLLAASTLLLTALGLHAVVTYWIVSRTHEIGVRMAIGATRGRVLAHFVGLGARRLAVGLAVGVVGFGLLASGLDRRLLYGVTLYDPVTMAAAILLLTAVSVCAVAGAAGRAARLDPREALRVQ